MSYPPRKNPPKRIVMRGGTAAGEDVDQAELGGSGWGSATWQAMEALLSPSTGFQARRYLEDQSARLSVPQMAQLGAIMRFVREYQPDVRQYLEVAGGPSLYPLLALTAALGRAPRQVTWTDVAIPSLQEVSKWVDSDPDAFGYDPLWPWLIEQGAAGRTVIEQQLRGAEWKVEREDLHQTLGNLKPHPFDVVSAHFCLEVVAKDEDSFVELIRHAVGGYSGPGTLVLLSVLMHPQGELQLGEGRLALTPLNQPKVLASLRRAGLHFQQYSLERYDLAQVENGPEALLFFGGVLV